MLLSRKELESKNVFVSVCQVAASPVIHKYKFTFDWGWECMPLIPAFLRQRQIAGFELKARLVYMVSFMPARATVRPHPA